jgi:hypothetical protein
MPRDASIDSEWTPDTCPLHQLRGASTAAALPPKPPYAAWPWSGYRLLGALYLFLLDKRTQGMDGAALKKYERELGRFNEFMANRGRFFPHEITVTGSLALWPVIT